LSTSHWRLSSTTLETLKKDGKVHRISKDSEKKFRKKGNILGKDRGEEKGGSFLWGRASMREEG